MRQGRRHLCLVISLFSLGLTNCGKESESADLQSEFRVESPYFVVMGGNQSCRRDSNGNENSPFGMSLYAPFFKLLQDLQNDYGIQSKFVVSCYDKSDRVTYAKSSNTEAIIAGSPMEAFIADTLSNREAQDSPMLIGHSYGGWLAMKSALVHGENSEMAALVTIDPISRVDCTFTLPLGCQRSPADFDQDERTFLRDTSDKWLNFFQYETWYLHATPIEQADTNIEIKASHVNIGTNSKVWEQIKTTTLERL